MTIEQELKELEKKKTELEIKRKVEKVQGELKQIKEVYEGKVGCHFVKTVPKGSSIILTYYKECYIDEGWTTEGRKEDRVYIKTETIEVRQNIYNQWVCSYKTKKDDKTNDYAADDVKKWVSLNDFNALKKVIKSVSSDLTEQVNALTEPIFHTTGNINTRIINSQQHLLDIPNILLTQDEVWCIGDCIFMIGNVYLLTPNSIKWLKDWRYKEQQNDSYSYRACASVGERWRNSRMDKVNALFKKIDNAYIEMKKNETRMGLHH